MNNENKKWTLLCMWAVAFNAGLIVADQVSMAAGFMISVFSTIIFALLMRAEKRIEFERSRIKKYQQDCADRAQEMLEGSVPNAGRR